MVSKTPPNKIADLVAPCKIYLFLASLFENGRFASHSHSIDETKPVMALMHPPKAALLHRSMYAKGTPLLECVVATAVADCHRLHHRRNDRRSCLHRCRRHCHDQHLHRFLRRSPSKATSVSHVPSSALSMSPAQSDAPSVSQAPTQTVKSQLQDRPSRRNRLCPKLHPHEDKRIEG